MSIFEDVENRLKLNQKETAKFIGVTRSAYSDFRNKKRKTPKYIEYHMEVILMLPASKIAILKDDRLG